MRNNENRHGNCTARRQPTLRSLLAELRVQNASRAYDRAVLASRLRHHAAGANQTASAKQLGRIKQQALRVAISIAPEAIHVGLDDQLQVGLLSITFPGKPRLHLPHNGLESAA